MNGSMIVKKTVDYIEAHMDEDLSLDRIADALCYSKFYLSRAFREETGCTVYKYIQRRRLTQAARKLVETKQPIVEIALEARYDSQQAFSLAFKQAYACTPKKFRQRGVFYPRQSRFTMLGRPGGRSFVYGRTGGRLAA